MTNNTESKTTEIATIRADLAREIEAYGFLMPPGLGDALTSAMYGQATAEQVKLIESHAASHGSKSVFRDMADFALKLQG